MSFTHALAQNNYGVAKIIVATSPANGTHVTLATAMAAASVGDTIFLRDTVTENVTITPGVNIAAWDGETSTPAIIGTLTMTAAGTSTISGIRLQTNSAALIAVTGSAASVLILDRCYLDCTNNTGITFSSSSASASISLNRCTADLGTTGIGLFSDSSAGSFNVRYSNLNNSGGSSTASTKSAGLLNWQSSSIAFPVTYSSSNTGSAVIQSNWNASATNSTCLTTSGTGIVTLQFCNVASGTSSAISIGSGTNVGARQCVINSSNTNAITGAGTLSYSGLSFSGSSSTINVTTQVVQNEGPSRTIGSANSGATNTLTVTNSSNTATSSANILSTVGGTTAADPTFQSSVSGTTTWTWGIDNSVTTPTADPWVLAQGTALGTNNVMSVATSGEINYPLQPSFFATASAVSNVTGDNTTYTVIFDSEVFDQNNDFDGTSTFTAPVTGRYRFDVKISINGVGVAHTGGSGVLVTSNRSLTSTTVNWGAIAAANLVRLQFTNLTDMDAADTATVTIAVSGGTKVVGIVSGFSFSGDLNE